MEKIGFYAETFNFREKEEGDSAKGYIINGLALPFGKMSRNGVQYDKQAAIKAAPSMEGCPVCFNHDENIVLGHVTKFYPDEKGPEGAGIYYEANLDPEEEYYLRKIKRKDIRKTSIQAFCKEELGPDSTLYIQEFCENSLVTIPGFPQTTVSAQKFAEKLQKAGEGTKMPKEKKEEADPKADPAKPKPEEKPVEGEEGKVKGKPEDTKEKKTSEQDGDEMEERIAKLEAGLQEALERLAALEAEDDADEEKDDEDEGDGGEESAGKADAKAAQEKTKESAQRPEKKDPTALNFKKELAGLI